MDRLSLNGMLFYGTHGVHAEEARLGQRFEVDVDMHLDTTRAGRTDAISDTVHYGQVYEVVKRVVVERRFMLIEALAAAVAADILRHFPLDSVTVRVRKPHAPIQGVLNGVEVEINRTREWLESQQ